MITLGRWEAEGLTMSLMTVGPVGDRWSFTCHRHHFGKDRNARDRFRDHPTYDRTVYFCEAWDQRAFDPNYESLPLSAFEPMVRRVFLRESRGFI